MSRHFKPISRHVKPISKHLYLFLDIYTYFQTCIHNSRYSRTISWMSIEYLEKPLPSILINLLVLKKNNKFQDKPASMRWCQNIILPQSNPSLTLGLILLALYISVQFQFRIGLGRNQPNPILPLPWVLYFQLCTYLYNSSLELVLEEISPPKNFKSRKNQFYKDLRFWN